MIIFVTSSPNFRWLFYDNSKNKNQKIDFSLDSAKGNRSYNLHANDAAGLTPLNSWFDTSKFDLSSIAMYVINLWS